MPGFTQSVGPNDVMFGRGSKPNNHPGNISFRAMIKCKSDLYRSVSTRGGKSELAQQLVNEILQQGGRFVRKLHPREVKAMAWADTDTATKPARTGKQKGDGKQRKRKLEVWYQIIDDKNSLIQKTNQAFRLAVREDRGRQEFPRRDNIHVKVAPVSVEADMPHTKIANMPSPMGRIQEDSDLSFAQTADQAKAPTEARVGWVGNGSADAIWFDQSSRHRSPLFSTSPVPPRDMHQRQSSSLRPESFSHRLAQLDQAFALGAGMIPPVDRYNAMFAVQGTNLPPYPSPSAWRNQNM